MFNIDNLDQKPITVTHEVQPSRTNGKAIAGLVLGILSVVIPYIGFIIGIVAIIISKYGMNEIKVSGEEGRGMAVAGLVIGIISVSLYGLIILFAILIGGIVAIANF